MIHRHPGSEVSIPQLLDTVEKKLDIIAETLRYSVAWALQALDHDELPFSSRADIEIVEQV
jgi:hypothetical protein